MYSSAPKDAPKKLDAAIETLRGRIAALRWAIIISLVGFLALTLALLVVVGGG